MNARIYGRYSSKPQEKGDSKRRQIEGAKAYAAKHGLNIISEPYFDEAVSGKAGANLEKQFGRLLKEATEGEAILVEFLDRLGRQNPFILGKLLYDTARRGITVISWQEGKTITPENIDTLETQFSVFTGSAVGHQENTRKIKRLIETCQQAYKDGEKGIQSGTLVKYLPQCYKWDDTKKTIYVDETAADVIRNIFKWFNDGIGRPTICMRLNKINTPTLYKPREKVQFVKSWNANSLTHILTNESYAGVLKVKGKRIDCIPKIISRETFDKTQMLLQRFASRRGKSSERKNNLLATIGICKHCKQAIEVHPSKPKNKTRKLYLAYRCRGRRNGTCQHRHTIPARIVELVLFGEYFGGSPENLFGKENTELKEKLETLNTKLNRLDTAISNLFDMVEQGDKDAKERIKLRRREKEETENEIAITKASITEDSELPTAIQTLDSILEWDKYADAVHNFNDVLEAKLADFETRKKLVSVLPLIFSKVELDTTARTIQPFKKDGTPLQQIDLNSFVD